MDVFGKIKPYKSTFATYDHSVFQETLEALLRASFENIGIVAIGKGLPAELATVELHLGVAEPDAETTKVLSDALFELFDNPFSFYFNGSEPLIEQAGFVSKVNAFVAQCLQWREDAITKAQHDAVQHDVWLHQPREESYEDTSEDWRVIRDASGTVVDYNYAD